MSNKFVIEIFDDTQVEALPIHYKTLEYFESFVFENILTEFNVIQGSKWTHRFGIFFDSTDYKNVPQHIKNFDGVEKFLTILPPTTFANESVKTYSVQFFISKIKDHPSGEYIGFCQMMLDFIETFFTLNYKKINVTDFVNIRNKLDWNYLISLKYPADLKDQYIVGNEQTAYNNGYK